MCASAQMCLLECVHAARFLDVLLWILYFKPEIDMQNRWAFIDSLLACLLYLTSVMEERALLVFIPLQNLKLSPIAIMCVNPNWLG